MRGVLLQGSERSGSSSSQHRRITHATGRAVLVVEDDETLRESICSLLREEKIPVHAAANGLEALDFLSESQGTALIILDLMMPGMNGWELRSSLRADPRFSKIPILIISAHLRPGVQAGPNGVTYILRKPFNAEDLVAYARRFARRDDHAR